MTGDSAIQEGGAGEACDIVPFVLKPSEWNEREEREREAESDPSPGCSDHRANDSYTEDEPDMGGHAQGLHFNLAI